MDKNVIKAAYIAVRDKYHFDFDLKNEQIDALTNVCNERHVLAVLPTGYGKTEIFVLAPLLMDVLDSTCPHFSLVVVPLLSLIQDMCERYQKKGIGITSAQNAKMDDLKEGKYSIILVTPEHLQHVMAFREVMELNIYQKGLCCFAVDEAHLLVEWGEVFRPSYSVIGEIRSLFETRPVLLLTATCTDGIKKKMIQVMRIITDVVTIAVIPDRPKISLSIVMSHDSAFEDAFKWYINELQEKGQAARKTIIYCRSLRHTGHGFGMMLFEAKGAAFIGGQRRMSNKMIGQYHAEMNDHDKERILLEFRKPDSVIRCLITTVAFGLGIDISDIRLVCHWGESDTVSQYWQEVGRAGRDGEPSEAILYHRQIQLNQCQPDMKSFIESVKKGTCMRQEILSNLHVKDMKTNKKSVMLECVCKCCSNCKLACGKCNQVETVETE